MSTGLVFRAAGQQTYPIPFRSGRAVQKTVHRVDNFQRCSLVDKNDSVRRDLDGRARAAVTAVSVCRAVERCPHAAPSPQAVPATHAATLSPRPARAQSWSGVERDATEVSRRKKADEDQTQTLSLLYSELFTPRSIFAQSRIPTWFFSGCTNQY